MSLTFDTLSAAKTLKGAGLTDSSAEAIVAVVRQSFETDQLATSADTAALRSDLGGLRSDLSATKADLKHEIEKMEGRLKLFVASTVLGGAGVIVIAQIVTKALGISA
jgi:hypothetical protein